MLKIEKRGRTWVNGDGSVAVGLVQISNRSLRKKEGFVGLWRKKEEMER